MSGSVGDAGCSSGSRASATTGDLDFSGNSNGGAGSGAASLGATVLTDSFEVDPPGESIVEETPFAAVALSDVCVDDGIALLEDVSDRSGSDDDLQYAGKPLEDDL